MKIKIVSNIQNTIFLQHTPQEPDTVDTLYNREILVYVYPLNMVGSLKCNLGEIEPITTL